jgi:VCBS repeat protein/PASTA domain-containing protein/FG-GAP repeat protein
MFEIGSNTKDTMALRPKGRRRRGTSGSRVGAALLGCSSLAITLGVAALSAATAPSFARARNYATGRSPASVAIGDLSGDGKPDLATANDATVSVLLNRGDGSFQGKHDYRTGPRPMSVAIGDLNRDGKPDVAVANYRAHTVSVLANRGDGSLQPKVDYATGFSPLSLAIGDLSGDGKPDLATANLDAGRVSVLLNRGDGSFQTKLDYATGDAPRSVAIGDLSGDSKPDLATANDHQTVSVLLNEGDGSFQASVEYGTRTGEGDSNAIAIGDLNGDGTADLATANIGFRGYGSVFVFINRGGGTFRAPRHFKTGLFEPTSVAIADLNGDGRADMATANRGVAAVSLLLNTGEGRFQAKLDYRPGGAWSVRIGDLNGDRRPDLASAIADENNVSVLLNTPGLCTVQDVKGQTLPAAKRSLARANCQVGRIRHAYSASVKRGRVISQKPKFGAVLPGGGKVNVVVSRGRRPS